MMQDKEERPHERMFLATTSDQLEQNNVEPLQLNNLMPQTALFARLYSTYY